MIDGVREQSVDGEEYLRDYRSRMSRAGRIYAAAVVAIVVIVVVGVVVAYRLGSLTHVTRTQVQAAGASPTLGTLSTSSALTSRWSTDQTLAQGAPVYDNAVVTFSGDRVYAHNVLTGSLLWSYARTDRTVCSVVQEQGKTVVLFRNGANCDELNTLVTSTGADSWQRTLSTDPATINGVPTTLPESDGIDYVTPGAVVKVSISGAPCDSGSNCGVNWWSYVPDSGCSITGFSAGSGGALIATKCATGYQIVLHDRYSSDQVKQVIFTRKLDAPVIPIAAGTGALVVYVPGTHQAQILASSGGTVQQSVSARFASGLATIRVDDEFTDNQSVVCDGSSCQLVGGSAVVTPFTSAVTGPIDIDTNDNDVYGVDPTGALVRLSQSGEKQQSWTLPAHGYSRAYRVSSGFVVGGGSGTAYVS